MEFDEIIGGQEPVQGCPLATYNEATERLDILAAVTAMTAASALSEAVADKDEGPIMLGATIMVVGVLNEIGRAYAETLTAAMPGSAEPTYNLVKSALEEGEKEGKRLIAAVRALPDAPFDDGLGTLAILALFGEDEDEG